MIKTRKVSDISVNELKDIIKETFYEIIDPDHDLDISPEVKKELTESLRSRERIPIDEVAKRLGLEW
jgi:CBS domain containing-hemolysin-like protein